MIQKLRQKIALIRTDKNLSSLLLGSGVALFVSLFGYISVYLVTLLTGRMYGAQGVGILVMFQTLSALLVQFSLVGFPTLISRMTGSKRGANQLHEMRHILKSMISLSFFFWLSFSVIILMLSPWIAMYLFDDRDLSWLVCLIPMSGLGGIGLALCVAYLKGLRKIFLGEMLQISFKVITCLALVIVFFFSLEVSYIAPLAHLGGEFIMGVIAFLGLFWHIFHASGKKCILSPSYRQLLHWGFPLFLVFLSTMIMKYIDTMMIGAFLDAQELGVYSVAIRVVMVAAIPLGVLGGITSPEISRLHTLGDRRELNRVLRMFSFLITGLSLPVFLILFLFPEWVLGLFGNGFSGGTLVVRILVIGYLVHVWSGNNAIYMNMVGYERVYRNIVLMTSGVNIILNLILLPLFGIVGVAIGTSVSLIIWNLSANRYIYQRDRVRTYLWW